MDDSDLITFIGGGNMASAIIGGLLKSGRPASSILVVEPAADARARLRLAYNVRSQEAADASLSDAALVVWAVKPQFFADAAGPCSPYVGRALQLSVMAGVRTAAIAGATGSSAIVRAMPNTPALIGQGMTGLFAREGVSDVQRLEIEQLLAPTGRTMWVGAEDDLDAVTALSGSGPAYVFYVLEAMIAAAERMGLSAEQGRELALGTFAGATALAQQSRESPAVLRERVTSKGGTTYAALTSLESDGVHGAFVQALLAAQRRSRELGDQK